MLPMNNETLTVNELTRLNDHLRKNADMVKNSQVGYQTAAATSGGANGALSPIVPQSIESVLASATFTMNDLVLWQKLPKVQVTNTIHEFAVINEHGQDLDPFIEEGGGGSADFGSSRSSYERKAVKIKYMAERRSVSDVANLVGIIGANPNAIAEETERGTMSLMRKVESQLFYGDESASSKGFDGILKQIERLDPAHTQSDLRSGDLSGNTHDMGGAIATNTAVPELFNDVLGELHSAPRFGKPDVVFVEPRIYSQLVKASIQGGRNDQLLISQQKDGILTYGAGPQLHIMGPMGPVPVMSAPFLHRQFKAPTAGAGTLPTLGAGAVLAQVADGVALEGEFAAGKFYKYKVVGVSSKGYSAPLTLDAGGALGLEVGAAGIQVEVAAAADMVGGYYRVYRSESAAANNAVDLDSCVLLYEVPAEADGSLVFVDRGIERHSCGRALFMQMDQNVVEFARMLDFLRRPLAETSAAKQFLLMLFGSPIVKVPTKCFTVRGIPYSQVF